MSYANNLNDDMFRVYAAQRIGAMLQLSVNGTLQALAPTGKLNVSAIDSPLTIGGYDGAPLRGDIAEIVMIAGPMQDGSLSRLERHLLDKYGLK